MGYRAGIAIGIGGLLLLAGCVPPDQSSAGAPKPAAAPQAPPGVFFGARVIETALDPSAAGTNGQATAMRVGFTLDDSPSRAAGLHEGDIILTVDGKPATADRPFQQAFVDRGPNATLKLTVLRDGHPIAFDVTTLPHPADLEARYNAYATTQMKSEHQAAADAQAAGDARAAFDHELRALRLSTFSSDPGARSLMDEGITRLAALLPSLRPPPAIPTEADWQNRRALAMLQNARSDDDYDRATTEFGFAMYAAPWVADIYLNAALTLEKAGNPEWAILEFRRYLILDPAPRDLDQIKQKLASLEVLAEERRPWLPFTGPSTRTDHSVEMLTLRGLNLKVTMVAPPNPPNARLDRVGDTILAGTVRGTGFTGKATNRTADEKTVRCFGPAEELNARGEIDPSGKTLVIRWEDKTFNINSCQTVSTKWDVLRTYAAAKPAP